MKFSIPESMSGAKENAELLQHLIALTGAEISITTVVILETEDERAAQIIRILLAGSSVEAAEKPVRLPTSKPKAPREKPFNSASREVVGPDKQAIEALTIEEKNYRLSVGHFNPGQLLRYKNGKYFKVAGKVGSPQKLVDKAAEAE